LVVGDQALLGSGIESKLQADHLAAMVTMVQKGTISSKIAKDIFGDVVAGKSPRAIVQERGLGQISDTVELEKAIQKVVDENPKAVQSYKAGEEKILGFLVGQVMKETRGQANPSMVNELVRKLLR
jgi:aspartyl-tRNA(Asn)/glutamyl-tRNA(Gln) amidotransferase subunit B